MKFRIAIAVTTAAALVACRGTGNTDNNSAGVSALTANNSAYRGGAAPLNVGDAITNGGTGVTGANGQATVTPQGRANSTTGKTGANAQNGAAGPSAPGTGGAR